jgi:hypothetical protein
MPMSTDLNLPKTLRPVFPDRCVACGLPSPESYVRVSTHAIGWWTIAFWVHGARFSVDVPSCEPCRRQMIRQKWLRRILFGIPVVVGMGVASSMFGSFHSPLYRMLMMGVGILCLIPFVVWETFFPRPIDLIAYSDTVDYEFLDEEYAQEFASLNYEAIEAELEDLAGSRETVG